MISSTNAKILAYNQVIEWSSVLNGLQVQEGAAYDVQRRIGVSA